VEEVVLHAANDAPERRNVESEDAVQVHAAKWGGHALGGTQNCQEQAMVARILPEFVVDQMKVALDESYGERADAADPGMLLQQKEQFEQSRRVV